MREERFSCLHHDYLYDASMYMRSLFIFRQDLRLQDNTALIEAMKHSETVFPIFIHDTRAIEDFGQDDVRFGFIREAIEAIDTELQKV